MNNEFQAPVSVRNAQGWHVGRCWVWRLKRNEADVARSALGK